MTQEKTYTIEEAKALLHKVVMEESKHLEKHLVGIRK
jgi:hypothetical protein